MEPGAIYARKSYGEVVETAEQVLDCVRYAAANGIHVIAQEEEIRKRDEMCNGDGLERIRDLMRRGKIQHVIVFKRDRIGSDKLERMLFRYEAQECGVTIHSTIPGENYPDGELGDLLEHIGIIKDAGELTSIRIRAKRWREKRSESGKFLPHPLPLWGLTWANKDKTAYQFDEEKVDAARLMWELAHAGKTGGEVVAELKARGIPTPSGKGEWRHETINRLLHNPMYWGQPVARRTLSVRRAKFDPLTGKKRYQHVQIPNQTYEPLVGCQCPALVTPEYAAEVHALFAARTTRRNYLNSHTELYLLRGMAQCGRCGRTLTSQNAGHKYDYRCRTSWEGPDKSRCVPNGINQEILDTAVWTEAVAFCSTPENVLSLLDALSSQYEQPHALEVEMLKRRNTELEKTRLRLESAIRLDFGEPLPRLVQMLRDTEREITEMSERLQEIQSQNQEWSTVRSRMQEVLQKCRGVTQQEEPCYVDKRNVLKMLNPEILVYPRGEREPRYTIRFLPEVFITNIMMRSLSSRFVRTFAARVAFTRRGGILVADIVEEGVDETKHP